MTKGLFITGIGTNVGKTITSAIFVKATGYAYWKPIQCGDLNSSDSHTISALVPEAKILTTFISLKEAISPHAAAKIERVHVSLEDFINLSESTIVEGAGGVLVPLNEKDLILDLASKFQWDIVIVCQYYLGSINHTLLTINEVKRRGLNILGLVFNGSLNLESRDIILTHHPLPVLLEIDEEVNFDGAKISLYADILRGRLNEL